MFEMIALWIDRAAGSAPPFFLIVSALVICAAAAYLLCCMIAPSKDAVLDLTAEMAIPDEDAGEHARPAKMRSAIEPWRRRTAAKRRAAANAPELKKAA